MQITYKIIHAYTYLYIIFIYIHICIHICASGSIFGMASPRHLKTGAAEGGEDHSSAEPGGL